MTPARITGTVRVVGAGLLGASVGLGLRARGVDVVLADASPSHLRLAVDYGAGRAASMPPTTDNPSLVVVAVPPDAVAQVVAAELAAFPDAVVTDVASIKNAPFQELLAAGVDLSRYVPGHPLAGRERGGPIAARADLFFGRPWVVCEHPAQDPAARRAVEALVLDLGAAVVELTPEAHDDAVALVSHVPQLVSTLLAARLRGASASTLGLAGGGLRDTTRIAASQPELWVQILAANAAPVRDVLRALRADLDTVLEALDDVDAPGARRVIAETLAAGNQGVARIPGKHGHDERYTTIVVLVDDKPGELARLLTELGELGINLEDLRLEHSPEAEVGLAEISVLPEVADRAAADLIARGWRISG